MLQQDQNILSTSTTADSGWIDVSTFENWSLFISALESGATITVYAKNATGKASDQPDVLTGAKLVATFVAASAPGFVGQDSCQDPSGNVIQAHFILVKKTAGGSPTATNVQMFARSFDL